MPRTGFATAAATIRPCAEPGGATHWHRSTAPPRSRARM